MFAAYAAISEDRRLTIAGTLDTIHVTRPHDAPDGDLVVPIPPLYLISIAECGISEGTTHEASLRVLDDDGKQVADPASLGTWNFLINPYGRPMRFQQVLQLGGLVVPRAGDYAFELSVDGKVLGTAMLYVQESRGTP